MRKLIVLTLILFCCYNSTTFTLDDLIKISITNNKELISIRFEALSAESIRNVASSVDNPYLTYELSYIDNNYDWMLGLRIPLTLHKKPYLYRLYDIDLNLKKLSGDIKTLEITNSIRKLYYKNVLLHLTKDEYIRLKDILINLEKIISSKYLSGLSSQKDLLKVKSEISKINTEIYDIEAQIQMNENRLLYLAGLSPITDYRIRYDLSSISNIIYFPYHHGLTSTNELLSKILSSIYFNLIKTELEYQKFRRDFSFIEVLPEIMLSVKSDFMKKHSIMIEAEIPIFFARTVNVVESEKFMYNSKYMRLEDKTLMVYSDIISLISSLIYYKKSFDDFNKNVLSPSKTLIDLSFSEYLSGKVGIEEVIENIRNHTENTIQYYTLIDMFSDKVFELYSYGISW